MNSYTVAFVSFTSLCITDSFSTWMGWIGNVFAMEKENSISLSKIVCESIYMWNELSTRTHSFNQFWIIAASLSILLQDWSKQVYNKILFHCHYCRQWLITDDLLFYWSHHSTPHSEQTNSQMNRKNDSIRQWLTGWYDGLYQWEELKETRLHVQICKHPLNRNRIYQQSKSKRA